MGGFQELGLSAGLVNGLDRLGYARPTSVQRSAIPVLRRGGNAVIHAGSGAGVTAAYGLPLIDRLQEAGELSGVRALIVTPTAERAHAIALELSQLGEPAGVRATVLAPAWHKTAPILVIPVHDILPLLQSSALKLDQMTALILHDASAILALGGDDALESLMPTVPRDAQRIVVTTELNPAIDKLLEAHARKALHVPARPAVEAPSTTDSNMVVEYVVANRPQAPSVIAERLAGADTASVVYCRKEAERTALAEELKLRGLTSDVRLYGDAAGQAQRAYGLGAPFDGDTMLASFAKGGLVVIVAAELPHLKLLARQSNITLRASPARAEGEPSAVQEFRDTIRRALGEEDVDAQLLVIEPLLAEFSAVEVAAAVTALLRKRTTAAPATVSRAGPSSGAPPPTLAKLFLSVGTRDTITARELVGAITGEAGIAGDQIGKVEIRDTFSVVEVSSEVAERVIRALNGTSLRGRSLRVDYDRKPSTQRRALPARRSRPPRQ